MTTDEKQILICNMAASLLTALNRGVFRSDVDQSIIDSIWMAEMIFKKVRGVEFMNYEDDK